MFWAAAGTFLGFYLAAVGHVPDFGTHLHPYRTRAVAAAIAHHTANVVSSVNFDQRALDTLIEETIMLASILGAVVLLRPAAGEEERRVPDMGRILDSTRLIGYVVLPFTIVIGLDIVVHGHLTPGGGFQGGVVLATGVHLLYVAGSFRAIERVRPLLIYRLLEAAGAAGFVVLGLAGMVISGGFLTNAVAQGRFAQLFSAGTVPLLNGLVGVEIAAGVVVLLAAFLDQEILVRLDRDEGYEAR